ncbi:DUF4188 domain-containing protein [Salinadaptatus halalkaliphilus]|uniref:DUF4188 domain-containing protein n=1 Tax=Salinadaptatus halalkaliphilus TaxID=2419781 RepID=A0A4S3TQT4_9EURY|nr:DUF4188 domain-containing protein [Salinadaptatus halalkaliphilus]THE65683.1 DUF4188 domain-containing protein [Salinadaptatus halalkaliphilus]
MAPQHGDTDSRVGDQATANSRIDRRVTAERADSFVVFHIGMRINAFWKLHRWLPIFLVAGRMVRELLADEDSGLLESRTVVGPGVRQIGFVQYWESVEALEAYAHDDERLHRPAWLDYYRDGTDEDGAVGIWHETYRIEPGEYETVYNNLPPQGLAACERTAIVSATGRRRTAAGRLDGTADADRGAGSEPA